MITNSGTVANPRMDLGKAIEEYFQEESSGFIGTRVFPVFKSMLKASSIPAITRASLAQDVDTKRSKRSGYNRAGFEVKDITFACEENGIEQPLDDGEVKLYKSMFDAELAASKIAARRVLQAQERRIAALCFNTTDFAGSSLYTDVSSAPWDAAGSDVISHVKAARAKVRANCGMSGVSLVIGDATLQNLTSNTAIRSAIQYVKELTDEQIKRSLAGVLGVKEVIVGGAIRNSANEGKTFSAADIWSDDYALLAILPSNPDDISEPALGRTFMWVDDCPENAYVESYRDEKVRSNIYRARQHTHEKLIDAYFGHLLKVDA